MKEKKTKIIATIGPASETLKTLILMKKAGMNAARINTAHGDFKQYEEIINRAKKLGIPVILDIKGPEMRVRWEQNITVRKGEVVEFNFKKGRGPWLSSDVYDDVQQGDAVYIDNGQIRSTIIKKNKTQRSICLRFDEDATIIPNKGVNIPYKELSVEALSTKDKEVIELARRTNASYIALSFVRNEADVARVRKLLKDAKTKIIAKIENDQGIRNIDEIIKASDGVMIARGDLGIEVPQEKIPLLQKQIITACRQKGKFVIVATQMLESMTQNKNPTRAEVSDVANAVLDGTDALMLSGETAIGKQPVRSIEVMVRIAKELEGEQAQSIETTHKQTLSEEMSKAAYELCEMKLATKIVCVTRLGFSASMVSRFRPRTDILAVSDDEDVCKQLGLVWGVRAVHMDKLPQIGVIQEVGIYLARKKIVKARETIIFFAGTKTKQENISNTIEVHKIQDIIEHAARG